MITRMFAFLLGCLIGALILTAVHLPAALRRRRAAETVPDPDDPGDTDLPIHDRLVAEYGRHRRDLP